MPVSEKTKQSIERYRKANTKQVAIRFYPPEMFIFDWIKSNDEGVAPYIKRLVLEDMVKRGVEVPSEEVSD